MWRSVTIMTLRHFRSGGFLKSIATNGLTGGHLYSLRPGAPPRYSHPHGTSAGVSPFTSERQVLEFCPRAWIRFTPPSCRTPPGQTVSDPPKAHGLFKQVAKDSDSGSLLLHGLLATPGFQVFKQINIPKENNLWLRKLARPATAI